ncbi:hypothetical protein GX411_09670 [Candidatus Fermentibacteria bacterium]|nr:hypothetical protein [Candidatus Fermentibacteria bacterium]
MNALFLALSLVMQSDPLLYADDDLSRGATAVYTITVIHDTSYWIILECENPGADMNVVVASRDMDFDEFMSLPYYEDYQYARGFSLAEGLEDGPSESFTLTAPYTGPAYIVVHDIGETGGSYELKVF